MKLEKTHVDQLFTALTGIFPAWSQAIKTSSHAMTAKREWYQALTDEQITPDEMTAGLRKARTTQSQWLPSCGEFIGWCRPSPFVTKRQAWQNACDSTKLKKGPVLEAIRRTGKFNVQSGSKDVMYLFFDHYADVCNEILSGQTFLDQLLEPKPAEPKQSTMTDEQKVIAWENIRSVIDRKRNG